MNSTHLLLLSLACIAAGVVLSLYERETLATVLVAAGAGGLVKEIRTAGQIANRATKDAQRANQRADEALEATQTLRRDLLKPPGA